MSTGPLALPPFARPPLTLLGNETQRRILGKCLEREEDLIRVLSWITDQSNHADTPKTRNKIAALLTALRKGLSLGSGAISVSELVCGIAGFSGDDALKKDQLLEFALGVANDRLKTGGNPDAEALWMEAIRPVAVQAISTSKRPGCVVEALRILSKASGIPGTGGVRDDDVDGVDGADGDLKGPRDETAEQSDRKRKRANPSTTSPIPYAPIVRAALKSAPESPIGRETLALLTHAVASKQKVLDDRAMGRVVQWAGVSSTDSYRLLKALIKTRHVLPELYDSMTAISSAMVKSTDKTVRQLASSTMLAFLLDYPLGKKRLDHHIEFLLSNMAYEHSEGGRGAVCELLCHLARKFPPGVKKRFYDKFVFFAFARAANEESREVRRRVVDDLLVGGLASPDLYGKYLGGFLEIRYELGHFIVAFDVVVVVAVVLFVAVVVVLSVHCVSSVASSHESLSLQTYSQCGHRLSCCRKVGRLGLRPVLEGRGVQGAGNVGS